MAESVSAQMEKLLKQYGDKVKEVAQKNEKKSAKAAATALRSSSPNKTGDYASGWTSKVLDDNTAVTYNRKAPGLTHLLENGHLIVNGKGEFGRAPAHPHIADVEKAEVAQFVDNIERDLQG